MSVKISGDTSKDLSEIYDAYILWASEQSRFESVEDFNGGKLFKGSTNVWISTDGKFVRLFLTQNESILNEVSQQLSSF